MNPVGVACFVLVVSLSTVFAWLETDPEIPPLGD